jgi:microcystin degradation protein MlrC
MRIAIGQLWQETNTFNPLPTTRASFEEFGVLRGDELVRRMAETNDLGGFIQSLRKWPERPDIVSLVALPAWPSGTVSVEGFRWLRDELLGALRQSLPVDAVLLALHGAMVADGASDVEGEILAGVRELVGATVPVVATLDLHTNITRGMVGAANALVLYHTYPHIDIFETGQRAARVLRRILIDGAKPVTAFQKVPMVNPPERFNTQDPTSAAYALRQRLEALEADERCLAAGVATVQPWLDIPEMGNSVLVVTDGDAEFARSACAEAANGLWQHRRDFLPELVPAADAVRQAHQVGDGLVVLSDGADATTSGAPGDSTYHLRELLRRGVGAELTTSLGGVRDRRFGQSLTVTAEVVNLFDARFVMSGHLAHNLAVDLGPSAVLRRGNVYMVVTSRVGPHFAPAFFRTAGLDPFAASVVVAKSPGGFRAEYQAHAKKIILVQSPGCSPSDFWRYEYTQIPRPLWPWDEITSWRPEPSLVHG